MAIDPNVDSEYVGLSPLTLDDIRNFFDSYIKPYAPYREEKVYNTLMNTLSEYYYGQIYTVVPNDLKQIYENANFDTPSIYNQLLITIGVPQPIIDKLSLSDKLIFLRTLADFERYKGTISFFQKVAETFSDRISIYELFIDRNLSGNWVFKPVKVYVNDNMSLYVSDIPYSIIYNSVPSLLLSEEQLTTLYENEQLILPIKSNLILLDNDLMNDVSMLYDIIVAIFLHEYQDNYIDIYFKDGAKTIQLKTLYFLWYYLLTVYYGIPWTAFANNVMLRFIYSDIEFPAFIGSTPTTIDNLDKIIERYDDIGIVSTSLRDYDNSRTLRDKFYEDIADAFYNVSNSSEITDINMRNDLLITDPSLVTYIDDRLATTSIGKQGEVNLILTEIYSSLLLYASTYTDDMYFSKYVDYFLRYLPQILIRPENTITYTILYNLKPYHVDLYSISRFGVRIQDKFNQIYIDDESDLKFLCQIMQASMLSFADDNLFNYIFNTESNVNIFSYANFNVIVCTDDDCIVTNLSNDEYIAEFQSLINNIMLTTSDDYLSHFDNLVSDTVYMDESYTVTKVP